MNFHYGQQTVTGRKSSAKTHGEAELTGWTDHSHGSLVDRRQRQVGTLHLPDLHGVKPHVRLRRLVDAVVGPGLGQNVVLAARKVKWAFFITRMKRKTAVKNARLKLSGPKVMSKARYSIYNDIKRRAKHFERETCIMCIYCRYKKGHKQCEKTGQLIHSEPDKETVTDWLWSPHLMLPPPYNHYPRDSAES